MKTILSWTIGIIVGIILIKLLFWIFKIALTVVWFLVLAVGVYLVASFVHKLISKKYLS